MFEVGFTEIVLILGIALLVLGPQRLPKLAADLGRWAGKARAMARQLRSQLEQEAGALNDLRKPLDDLGNTLIDTAPPPRPTPAAQPATTAAAAEAHPHTATPDATDESKPA
jgi:Tat protein translocase TatB subunit